MSNQAATVTIDGVSYPLADFPAAERKLLSFNLIQSDSDQAEALEDQGLKPDECATAVHHEWNRSKAIVDGKLVDGIVLGTVYSGIVGFRPDGSFHVMSEEDDIDYQPNIAFNDRLEWLAGKVGYVVWVRRRDTGDGIMLPESIYTVAFTDPALQAEFLAVFPGASA